MIFSKAEIAEIRQRLSQNGAKDSEFPDAKLVKADDSIAIVQDGINKKILARRVLNQHPYLSLERLRKYLYRVTFDELTEDFGIDSFIPSGCSSYVKDGKLYRNLDFKYDNSASFIVRTKDFEGMSFITGLNDGEMNDDLISQLPYHVVDGVNNYGIKVSTHILYNDWHWYGTGTGGIPLTRLPYLVLSRVTSMESLADDLNGVLNNLYRPEAMGEYLLQVLVTDGETTFGILPPTSFGQPFVLQNMTEVPKLTNFRWLFMNFVERSQSDMQTRPTGIERFNMMPCGLEDLRFTKAYETPDRLSEFIGIDGTTKESTDAELTAIYNEARTEYLQRERDGKTWQTMHSVVYGDKMEAIYIQEKWEDNCVSGNIDGAVRYDEKQELTAEEKGQARENIEAISSYGSPTSATSILPYIEYNEQTLTKAQKKQARENIDADSVLIITTETPASEWLPFVGIKNILLKFLFSYEDVEAYFEIPLVGHREDTHDYWFGGTVTGVILSAYYDSREDRWDGNVIIPIDKSELVPLTFTTSTPLDDVLEALSRNQPIVYNGFQALGYDEDHTRLVFQIEEVMTVFSWDAQLEEWSTDEESSFVKGIDLYDDYYNKDYVDEHFATKDNIHDLDDNKQDKTDSTLQTSSKQIVGAINEVKTTADTAGSIAKGANQALSFADIQALISALIAADSETYNIGQNLYIVDTEVPDFWVSYRDSMRRYYIYTSDEQFIQDVIDGGGKLKIGYYTISFLETQKVDLTNYYTKSETSTLLDNKVDKVTGKGLSTFDYTANDKFKVTNAELSGNKVTSISSSSTDAQYPSAKCVYDLIGNVESLLDNLL